jgi:hypothetical protein
MNAVWVELEDKKKRDYGMRKNDKHPQVLSVSHHVCFGIAYMFMDSRY